MIVCCRRKCAAERRVARAKSPSSRDKRSRWRSTRGNPQGSGSSEDGFAIFSTNAHRLRARGMDTISFAPTGRRYGFPDQTRGSATTYGDAHRRHPDTQRRLREALESIGRAPIRAAWCWRCGAKTTANPLIQWWSVRTPRQVQRAPCSWTLPTAC